MTNDLIRLIFMAHGFTIKEGRSDLKGYVYEAAYALLAADRASLAGTTPAQPEALSNDLRDALWTLTEHNALHFGEQHNTVIQGRAALAAPSTPAQPLSDEQIFKLADILWERGEISSLSKDTAVIFARAVLGIAAIAQATPEALQRELAECQVGFETSTRMLAARAGWKWMAHPDRFNGQPMPVQFFVHDDGAAMYRPFDEDATDFKVELMDRDWREVEAPAPVGVEPTWWQASSKDANALEALAKEQPDGKFLKGSGVLKLIGAIRQLERENRELRASTESAAPIALHDALQKIKRTALDAMPGEVNKALSSIVRQCIDLQATTRAPVAQPASEDEHDPFDAKSKTPYELGLKDGYEKARAATQASAPLDGGFHDAYAEGFDAGKAQASAPPPRDEPTDERAWKLAKACALACHEAWPQKIYAYELESHIYFVLRDAQQASAPPAPAGSDAEDAARYRWLRDESKLLSYTTDTGPRPSTPEDRILFGIANAGKRNMDVIEILLPCYHLGPKDEPIWRDGEHFDYAANMNAAIDTGRAQDAAAADALRRAQDKENDRG